MKVWHNGRYRDSWQIPHRNRERYFIKFWFKVQDPKTWGKWIWGYAGAILSVGDPVELNLHKYRDEWLAANIGIANKIKRVTAEHLGADI